MFKKEEKTFVKNIASSGIIRSQFVVTDKVIKIASSGRKYIDITLKDKTGEIAAKIADNFE